MAQGLMQGIMASSDGFSRIVLGRQECTAEMYRNQAGSCLVTMFTINSAKRGLAALQALQFLHLKPFILSSTATVLGATMQAHCLMNNSMLQGSTAVWYHYLFGSQGLSGPHSTPAKFLAFCLRIDIFADNSPIAGRSGKQGSFAGLHIVVNGYCSAYCSLCSCVPFESGPPYVARLIWNPSSTIGCFSGLVHNLLNVGYAPGCFKRVLSGSKPIFCAGAHRHFHLGEGIEPWLYCLRSWSHSNCAKNFIRRHGFICKFNKRQEVQEC